MSYGEKTQPLYKVQVRGPTEEKRMELDPIRSESPVNPGSGFVAQTSGASWNLVLSVPSGYQFLDVFMYINGATAGTVFFYDGSAGSGATVFAAYVPSAASGNAQAVVNPYGVYFQSIVGVSAAMTIGIKVGGYFFAISAAD